MMNKFIDILAMSAAITVIMAGCNKENSLVQDGDSLHENNNTLQVGSATAKVPAITLTSKITELEDGFYAVSLFGCSTLAVHRLEGETLFGGNFILFGAVVFIQSIVY